MIGTVIGPYQIVERLGGGGFSTVYKGVDAESGQAVAVKVLRAEYVDDEQFVRRFEREAETLASLPDTPSIARCIGSGRQGDMPYLVMEFLDGEDLSQLLADRGRLSPAEVISLGRQMADALRTAHRAGVVHRDIKPQNIRLTAAGVAKLIDWGIARPSAGTRLTQTGLFIGTPPYIAPEVWEGGDADQRTDLYALGVVLYELLAGNAPFDGDTPAAIMRLHLQSVPRRLAFVRSDLPAGLESIVLKALARDPAQRFQSADQLLAALNTPDQPVSYPPPPERRAGVPVEYVQPPERPRAGVPANYAQPPSGIAFLTGRGAPVTLRPDFTMLGRSPRSDVLVDDGRVSAEHARIERRGDQYWLRDLSSRNGTYVNERRVLGAVVLRPGDQVRIGQTRFAFAVPGAPAPAQPIPVRPNPPRPPNPGVSRSAVPLAQSTDAHLLAALAHGTALLTIASTYTPLVPVVVPPAIWLLARKPSPYVAFHALQAVLYQVCVMVVLLVSPPSIQPLVWLAATAYAWFGALRCLQGRPFSYLFLSSIAGYRR